MRTFFEFINKILQSSLKMIFIFYNSEHSKMKREEVTQPNPQTEPVDSNNEDLCIICVERPRETVIVPCGLYYKFFLSTFSCCFKLKCNCTVLFVNLVVTGHMCACVKCANKLKTHQNSCPFCRKAIGTYISHNTLFKY
jgi:hypothetical protein